MRISWTWKHILAMSAASLIFGGAAAQAKVCSLAIAHVNVIPMDSERVVKNATVLVRDGKIAAIVPAAGAGRPKCKQVIEGAGKYLMPGLNDMHVHLETVSLAKSLHVEPGPIDYPSALALYIANGVTGIRVMSGGPDILAFRDSQRGTLSPYPRMIVASPMLAGDPPVLPEPITKILRTPDEARQAVRDYAAQGYDFIKVRENLSVPVFRAVIDEARKAGLYVDGHVNQGQGLTVFDVLRSGQKAIAHLDNLAIPMQDKTRDPLTYIELLRACDCFVESTIDIPGDILAQLQNFDGLMQRKEMRFIHPMILKGFWLPPNNPYLREKPDPKFFPQLYADEKALLKQFNDAGVHIVAGTDALVPMIIPGVSLHDELGMMVEAGLTPYQALKTATANPAAYVLGFADIGVLAAGRTANAVLVDGNPLDNIEILRDPAAVMINGNWRTREQLHEMLEATAGRPKG